MKHGYGTHTHSTHCAQWHKTQAICADLCAVSTSYFHCIFLHSCSTVQRLAVLRYFICCLACKLCAVGMTASVSVCPQSLAPSSAPALLLPLPWLPLLLLLAASVELCAFPVQCTNTQAGKRQSRRQQSCEQSGGRVAERGESG